MKIINTVTEKSIEINGVDTLRGTVNVITKDNPYVKGIESNIVIELSSSTKEYINILIADELLANPEYSDFVKSENYQPNFQKFPWGDEPEHDFVYRVWLSANDIMVISDKYFHIMEFIKADPINPSVDIAGGKLIYFDNFANNIEVNGEVLPSGTEVICGILKRTVEFNPRML